MNKSKGFTIIELIVVIAIIAVLAAIVLVNVTSYIAKGKVAAIKGNMATLLTNGAVYYDGHTSTFAGFDTNTAIGCGSGGSIYSAVNTANGGGGLTCAVKSSDNSAFCACSTTPGDPLGNAFCVDSTGVKSQKNAVCGTICNTTNAFCQ
jgi:prepilin-type N-terminal cleavage/methylation domain-containing protein